MDIKCDSINAAAHDTVKTAGEIRELAEQLSAVNQSYVLNTVKALLFSQQASEPTDTK